MDPVEKKPLYHYYPGSDILSIGGLGCNFQCKFCQNYDISQVVAQEFEKMKSYSPDDIIHIAKLKNPKAGIAFTYNEPLMNFDFVLDTSRLAHQEGIPIALVSNGYINPKPLDDLLMYVDAFNIDLKGFTDSFYSHFTNGRLEPVLTTLKIILKAGKHLEVTHLLVNGANDDKEDFIELLDWYERKLGRDIPLHISRYFPRFKFNNPPTSEGLLNEWIEIARQKLDFVYPGNVFSDASTYCSKCGNIVIERNGFNSKTIALSDNKCLNCGNELPIIT
jgi:pyruvate formate lyase activating enzyme